MKEQRGIRNETREKYSDAITLYVETGLSIKQICEQTGVGFYAFSSYLSTHHRDLILKRHNLTEFKNVKLRGKKGQTTAAHYKYKDAIAACDSMEYIEYNISQIARIFNVDCSSLASQLRRHYPDIVPRREQERRRIGITVNLQYGARKWSKKEYATAIEMLQSSDKTIEEVATVAGTSQVGVIVGGMNGNTIVENCKVYNSTVKAVKKVGSVVGYTAGGTVKDNYAENCVIEYSEKEASEILGYENTGSTVSGNTFNNITFVVSATALATELTPDANGVITLTRDYTVTGDWTSLALSGTVTIEGNNHTIKGINQPLVAGTGGINITVNDLTISESVIGIATVENGLGTAAFISYIDHSGKASFTNCHLFESKVTGNERAAALLAFSEASEVSIKNCSVVKCELTSVGGAAGLVAYTHSTTTVENSKVENTIVEATEDRTSKTALAGAVIGTVNANTTFTNVTVSGNTVKNNGADAHSDMVGRVVSGTLTVN